MSASALVLEGADLDLLELALGGALPGPIAVSRAALPAGFLGTLVLTDGENTPLAEFTALPDAAADVESPDVSGLVVAGRPFATGTGAASDAALRRAAGEVRASVAPAASVLAIVFDALPTRAGLLAAHERIRAEGADVVLWVALVSREGRRGVASDDAVVRAVMAERPQGARGLVVPAPAPTWAHTFLRAAPGADARSVLARYGATSVFRAEAPGEVPGGVPGEVGEVPGAARLDEDARLDEAEIRRRYPPAAAAEALRVARRASAARGAMVLFTGLSGSGKSTLARSLAARLEHESLQAVTLLDGDEVRQLLSSELGFDRASRELNVRRIGYVASLVVRSGGIAIAAPIAPFESSRKEVRRRVEAVGAFVLVHVSTPLAVCEARDRKGLYAKARAGEIAEFTGISSPYEAPSDADVVVDTSQTDVDAAVALIMRALQRKPVCAGSVPHAEAAVDGDDRTGDVASVVAREPGDDPRDL
ncbi:adenylyl-sulfate kinase [Microbacterium sp. STN6]|uniref:adenylyl-sulfate kinase n=1 Tax=Microbacterium sp. STN6 TaxID=2995588 RepID=UPI002260B644|nr:adenylyl-sulfate kinase [Microbacterium sp. STN6]MCX7521608.1 adenylyl-sulfate kinase [Microbacterium sp. STN6]